MSPNLILLTLHVIANLVWIGSIAAVGLLVSKSAGASVDPTTRAAFGSAARAVYRSLAAPAFGASFLLGIALVARDPGGYFHQHWFLGKLTAALVVIALHHVVGGRAKRAEAGTLSGDGGARMMTLVLLIASAAAVFFVVVRP